MIFNFATERRSAQRGFTLLELAVVLAVVGTLMSALWSIAGNVQENMKRNTTFTQITVAVQNIRTYFQSKARIEDTTGNTDAANLTDFLIRQAVLPPEMLRKPSTSAGINYADNAWGRAPAGFALSSNTGGFAVMAGPTSINGVVGTHDFTIELRGLKQSSCIAMAVRMTGSSAPKGLTAVRINGTNIAILPVRPEDVGSTCEQPSSNAKNVLAFDYRLREQEGMEQQ